MLLEELYQKTKDNITRAWIIQQKVFKICPFRDQMILLVLALTFGYLMGTSIKDKSLFGGFCNTSLIPPPTGIGKESTTSVIRTGRSSNCNDIATKNTFDDQ